MEEKRLRDRILKNGLINYLGDNIRGWQLRADGTYLRVKPGSARPRDAQQHLLELLGG
jgi:polyphosphate kinase